MSEGKTVSILQSPGSKSACAHLQKGISEDKTVILVGDCSVEYRGRASSKLGFGQRLVIIKEDKSVLVHRPREYSAVNWQPSGCLFETKVKGNNLAIKAYNRKSKEILSITFKEVHAVMILSLVDEGKFSLYASEEDMQRAVLANPSLLEEGFRPINYEKRVKPGFIDVYGVDSRGRFVVVEIKRRTVDRGAVMQLAKYLEFVRGDRGGDVRGVLLAPSIGRGVQKLLASLKLEFKPLDPRRCAELLDRARLEERLEDYFKSRG